MAQVWKEKFDPKKHRDFMSSSWVGGIHPQASRDNLIETWVYFVHVCSFTFQFQSVDQLEQCLKYFSQKTHPSSRMPDVELEHYWQRWYERLPIRLFEEPKRQKVIKALQKALDQFTE